VMAALFHDVKQHSEFACISLYFLLTFQYYSRSIFTD
jgi:hypothetical protein